MFSSVRIKKRMLALDILAMAITQGKETKHTQIGKEELNHLYSEMIQSDIENPKESTKKILKLMSLVKLKQKKDTNKNQLYLYILPMANQKDELFKERSYVATAGGHQSHLIPQANSNIFMYRERLLLTDN